MLNESKKVEKKILHTLRDWIITHCVAQLCSRPSPTLPPPPHHKSYGIMWLSSAAAADHLDTITATLVVEQPLSAKRCQSTDNVQSSAGHQAARADHRFVWPQKPLLSTKTRGLAVCCACVLIVLCFWSLAANKINCLL